MDSCWGGREGESGDCGFGSEIIRFWDARELAKIFWRGLARMVRLAWEDIVRLCPPSLELALTLRNRTSVEISPRAKKYLKEQNE